MAQKLTLTATLRAKPGMEEELGRRLSALVEATRKEPGCINYDLHRSNDNPAVWMLYESWGSWADLDIHFATPYLKNFLAHMDEVLAEPYDMRFYSMTTQHVPPKY